MAKESEKIWFIYDHKVVRGPYAVTEIRAQINEGNLKLTDLFWRRGHREWLQIEDFDQHAAQEARETNPIEDVWYIEADGFNSGPFQLDVVVKKLKEKELPKTAKVWTSGLTKWISFYEVPRLGEELNITRRQYMRAPYSERILINGNDVPLEAEALTLSAGGMGLRSAPGLAVGQEISINMNSPALTGPVYARAKVVYTSGEQAGLCFTSISSECHAAVVGYVRQFELAN